MSLHLRTLPSTLLHLPSPPLNLLQPATSLPLRCLHTRSLPISPRAPSSSYHRTFASASSRTTPPTTEMETELTAPNGLRWTQPLGLFINNEFVPSSNSQRLTTVNPYTEQDICSVFAATEADVDKAVVASRAAFRHPSWKSLSGTDRGRLLYSLADLLESHANTLATIETLDNGKPLSVSRGADVPELIAVLRYYAGWADKIHGQTIDVGPSKLAYTLREPLGVCGQIIPWNYPLDMAAWKLGPALAAGNTVVLKLAEQTPLSMLYVASLLPKAGFPPGVINIINGHGREAGSALASHPAVAKIAFTGSTATGVEIMRLASSTMKSITLETGGKSPLLVFPDADLGQAVKWAHEGIMSNQGQICTATSRILVHKSVHDAFVARFCDAVKEISVVGDPFDEATFQGPQITRAQLDRILGYVESAVSEGAVLSLGGTVPPPAMQSHTEAARHGKGFFIQPTVLTKVTPQMRIFREEVFGPCAAISTFSTEEEALDMANDSTYGLGAAVFTRDVSRAHRVAAGLEAGMVWVNSSNDSDFRVPFGGVKMSGIGRELGMAGWEGYTTLKAVHVNLGD